SGFIRLYFTFISLSNLLLIISTGSRSVLIGLVVILVSWIIMKSYHHLFYKLFYIIITMNLLFIGIYVSIKDTFIGRFLNDLSFSIFNKNLISGRNEIWNTVIHSILNRPFFGYGVVYVHRMLLKLNQLPIICIYKFYLKLD